MVLLMAVSGCAPPPTAPTPPEPVKPSEPKPNLPEFITYEGQVVEPMDPAGENYLADAKYVTGIPDFKVKIIGGEPDGWTTTTDAEGRFRFEDYPYCELHTDECRSRRFRVEKAGYQTREVGASDPFIWGSVGDGAKRFEARWKRIVVSLEWPADPQIQRMLRELPAVSPLWLMERPSRGGGGGYVSGMIWVCCLDWAPLLAHEYCHAHQDWVADPDYFDLAGWDETPQAQAFLAAWEADLPTRDPLITPGAGHASEDAADICAVYFIEREQGTFGLLGPGYLRERLPHLYAWAEEWLRHR